MLSFPRKPLRLSIVRRVYHRQMGKQVQFIVLNRTFWKFEEEKNAKWEFIVHTEFGC